MKIKYYSFSIATAHEGAHDLYGNKVPLSALNKAKLTILERRSSELYGEGTNRIGSGLPRIWDG